MNPLHVRANSDRRYSEHKIRNDTDIAIAVPKSPSRRDDDDDENDNDENDDEKEDDAN